jgi:hypothetical protein
MAGIALALAFLIVLTLLGSRALQEHGLGQTSPAFRGGAGASGQKAGPAPDAAAFPCSLPVLLQQETDTTTSTTPSFVSVPGGQLLADPKASVAGLPRSGESTKGSGGPVFYSAPLGRWLPTVAQAVSPDGRSYAYVVLKPDGASYRNFKSSELHVYDAGAGKDRMLWSDPGSISILIWNTSGIVVDAVPQGGGVLRYWRIDPSSGAATPGTSADDPMRLPPGASAGPTGLLGSDVDGARIFRFGSRDPGATYSIVRIEPGGQQMVIYSGTAGDAKDFDPTGAYGDAHGIWFGNGDASRVWLWSAGAGLKSFKLSGLPAPPVGTQHYNVTIVPAGPCTRFSGSGAPAPRISPAPTPTPTPVPVVDFSRLASRPLSLPQVGTGSACPTSAKVQLPSTADTGSFQQNKGLPDYGFGQGPVYLSGQLNWYSAGPQTILLVIDPRYSGPILVRGGRLGGSGALGLSGPASTPAAGGIGIPLTSTPPYWGLWQGTLSPPAADCYGMQIDGDSFTEVIVFAVQPGPPPGG